MKRHLALAGGVLAALVVVELVLQCLACVAWLDYRREHETQSVAGAGSTVLCLGDSYTFGMGASSPEKSYPDQLQEKLQSRLGNGWAVVNRGWPARNSRELLEALDRALVDHQPKVVCVVVGVNDSWSRPEPLILAPLGEGPAGPEQDHFRWRLRSLRFLRIFGAAVAAPEAEAAESPDDHLQKLRDDLASGDTEGAQHEVEWLVGAYHEQPTQWVTEALVEGLQASGREQEALDLAVAQIENYPDSARLWLTIAVQSLRTGDDRTARTAIENALDAASSNRGGRAFLWRTRANVYSDTDRTVVADSLIRAFLEEGDETSARQWFQIHRRRLDGALLRDRCRALDMSDEMTARVLEIFDEAVGDAGVEAAQATLELHLRQVVERCRSFGAEPMLGSYPWHGAFGAATTRALAEELGVRWVPVDEYFSAAQVAAPEVPLFVHDGHCNDAGYGLMAEAFAEAIVQRFSVQKDP